jgi:hypothetical protein
MLLLWRCGLLRQSAGIALTGKKAGRNSSRPARPANRVLSAAEFAQTSPTSRSGPAGVSKSSGSVLPQVS